MSQYTIPVHHGTNTTNQLLCDPVVLGVAVNAGFVYRLEGAWSSIGAEGGSLAIGVLGPLSSSLVAH